MNSTSSPYLYWEFHLQENFVLICHLKHIQTNWFLPSLVFPRSTICVCSTGFLLKPSVTVRMGSKLLSQVLCRRIQFASPCPPLLTLPLFHPCSLIPKSDQMNCHTFPELEASLTECSMTVLSSTGSPVLFCFSGRPWHAPPPHNFTQPNKKVGSSCVGT